MLLATHCKQVRHTAFKVYKAANLSRPQLSYYSNSVCRYSDLSAELGLRTRRPPDSTDPGEDDNKRKQGETEEISDNEWEIRTGRAIYLLQETLPTFFSTGLISSIDKHTGQPRHVTYRPVNPLDFHSSSHDVIETIYSPKVRLAYTPPITLPVPFPQTLHVEGLPLYMASSVFVRHTLNALYSNLHVDLRKITVQTSASSPSSLASNEQPDTRAGKSPARRDKSVFVRLTVTGTARVSGGPGQWDVNSTYTFSPVTGLIRTHIINSIDPAPHQAVYHSLRTSLGKVLGLGGLVGEDQRAAPGGASAGAAYEAGASSRKG